MISKKFVQRPGNTPDASPVVLRIAVQANSIELFETPNKNRDPPDPHLHLFFLITPPQRWWEVIRKKRWRWGSGKTKIGRSREI